jgi:hypothetical protein
MNTITAVVLCGTFPSILFRYALHDHRKKKKEARQNRERQERNGPDPNMPGLTPTERETLFKFIKPKGVL